MRVLPEAVFDQGRHDLRGCEAAAAQVVRGDLADYLALEGHCQHAAREEPNGDAEDGLVHAASPSLRGQNQVVQQAAGWRSRTGRDVRRRQRDEQAAQQALVRHARRQGQGGGVRDAGARQGLPRAARRCHINSIEGAWSLFKRQVNGTHHWISVKHLQAYLDEMCYRYNRRDITEGARINDFLERVSGRLAYKALVA